MEHQNYTTQFTGQWEQMPVVNAFEGPAPRCGHTMTTHGKVGPSHSKSSAVTNGKLLVTFGESSLLANREYLGDMFLLDLESMEWAKILGKNIAKRHRPFIRSNFFPVARADHAAVAFGNKRDRCLIFGGKCNDTYLDDLIMVKNISSFPVSEADQSALKMHHSAKGRFSLQRQSKQILTDCPLKIESIYLPTGPCGRRGSSLCPWKEGSFLLFGGQRGSLFFNDLWGLDLFKQGWVQLSTRRNPMPRAFHSAFVDSQQQMLLLGGVRDTEANPAPEDIFKLDLRAGKFFKLSDKDMVPGIASALCKGHHSSHFLTRNCDLVIYAPQKATAHLLGGNVTSEHCGCCSQIKAVKASPSDQEGGGGRSEKEKGHCHPLGSCRPATALVEAHRSHHNLRTVGCNERPLERLFVFGGYLPAARKCSNKLYALKFSTFPCSIEDHCCRFTETPLLRRTLRRKQEAEERHKERMEQRQDQRQEQQQQQQPPPSPQQQQDDDRLRAVPEDEAADKKAVRRQRSPSDPRDNLRDCNVTPMRTGTRSRLRSLPNHGNATKPGLGRSTSTNGQRGDDRGDGGCSLNASMLMSPSAGAASGGMHFTFLSSKKAAAAKSRLKTKRVSIVQTPVRARQCISSDYEHKTFVRSVSVAANQKIEGLDPGLVAEGSPKGRRATNRSRGTESSNGSVDGRLPSDAKRRSVASRFIDALLINFDGDMLSVDHPFLLDADQVIELLFLALPLLEKDSTLTHIEAPCKVFGDIHGQLRDLMSLFRRFGYPDPNIGDISHYKYVFLGDFVDRGQKCMEIMCLLLALKVKYPERVYLIRGNHECAAMNEMYGFYHEINDRVQPHVASLRYVEGANNEMVENHLFPDEGLEPLRRHQLREQQRAQRLRESGQVDLDEIVQIPDVDYEEIELAVDSGDDSDDGDLSDISSELNLDSADISPSKLRRSKRKRVTKQYRPRKFFTDHVDCIRYLTASCELVFRWLPLAILVSGKILCVHGGIGQIESIEEIAAIERPCDVVCDMGCEMDATQKKVVDLLWSDPAEKDSDRGFQPNKRGVSCVFGSDIVRNFCSRNKIDLIVRGHQVVRDGFEYFAGGHLITLFSATNYCNVMDNAGAILCIDEKLRVLPKLVEAQPLNNGVDEDSDDDDDDDEESADNLQWKKLKQFPPSPMRGSGDGDDAEDREPRDLEQLGGGNQLTFDGMDSDDSSAGDSDGVDCNLDIGLGAGSVFAAR